MKSKIGTEKMARIDADFVELEARDPKNPSLAFWRGRNLMAGDDPAGAAKHFERAFDLGLNDARVLSLWIRSLLLSGQLDQAAKTAETKTVEVVPDTGVWLMVGSVHLARNELRQARNCADRADRSARTKREQELVSRFRHNLSTGNDK